MYRKIIDFWQILSLPRPTGTRIALGLYLWDPLRSCHLPEIVSLFVLFLMVTASVHAAPYKVGYTAEYFPKNNTDFDVKLTIALTNLRADVYVRQFSMIFPAHFDIESPQSSIDNQSIETKLIKEKMGTTVTFSLPENTAVKNNQISLHLGFVQKNGINHNGSIWEVLLPTISNRENSTFTVIFHVPPTVDRHLSISKPKPSEISGDIIRWNNVDAKVVYLVFGSSQRYQANLNYTVKNPDFLPKNTQIALPPQTSFQKVYEGNIYPAPVSTHIDTDGNYIADYRLNPKQELTVHYSGIIEVFARPIEQMSSFSSHSFNKQESYIYDRKSYWSLENDIILPEESGNPTIKSIFDRVVAHLTYNTGQINSSSSRKGASMAVKKPDQAVCTEYTDLFVALARKAGFAAREIEGYGYSDDVALRPRSFSGDILHSWPEYYDETQKLWVPIDPTWTDTSTIDYFNSFDVNHIVLAIHGKDPVYPLPAGMYKLKDSQDIDIKPISVLPKEVSNIVTNLAIPSQIAPLTRQGGSISIVNDSNIFQENMQVLITGSSFSIQPKKIFIDLMAPHEKKVISFEFSVSGNDLKSRKTSISLSINGKKVVAKSITMRPSYESVMNQLIGIVVAVLFLSSMFYFVFKRKRL